MATGVRHAGPLCSGYSYWRQRPGKTAWTREETRARAVREVAALLWWLPSTLGGTVEMALLWLPDLGWGLVAAIGLALLLAVERTALAALDLRRQRGDGRAGPGGTTERRPI
ncbi:hypothetical protein HFP69_17580 [Streptomyces sp. ARC12]|uniref:hypothetical protein n=1 Tax=Streptomyces sp. ARC12 TaxID=2724151 RepID=UPI003857A143